MQPAGFDNGRDEFENTMEALHARARQEPNDPHTYCTIAACYWEKVYRDFTMQQADRILYVKQGLEAIDKAIELKPDYVEALAYKNLLLRVRATLEKDSTVQEELLREADAYRDQAIDIRNTQRAAGVGD